MGLLAQASDKETGRSFGQDAPLVARPARVRVENEGSELRLSWRWWSWRVCFLVFFCISWDASLVFWYSVGIANPAFPWIFFVFPIVHLAVGVSLTYFTLAILVNRTVVLVDQEELQVRHGPLPWLGNLRIPVDQIAQLYVGDAANGDHGSEANIWSFRRRYSVALRVLLRDGASRTLLRLEDLELALYLEREIEKFLGIPDKLVEGELRNYPPLRNKRRYRTG